MEIKHPLHPEEITPEWITFALREGGILYGSTVSVVKVELTYDKPEAGVPESVPLYNHENLAHKQDS